MTIQVFHHEPDVLITTTPCDTSSSSDLLLWKQSPPIESSSSPSSHDDFMLFHKPLLPYGSRPDDDDSVMTLSSTASSSDLDLESNTSSVVTRVVTFAPELVTEEWTRPYTPTEDLGKLYYSTQETQRFRQEYRIERKLQSSSSVASPTSVLNDEDLWEVPQSLSTRRRGISRVVVLHNDTLATFSSPETLNGASADGINESVAVPDTTSTDQGAEQASDFFDTPEFWSGSITWW